VGWNPRAQSQITVYVEDVESIEFDNTGNTSTSQTDSTSNNTQPTYQPPIPNQQTINRQTINRQIQQFELPAPATAPRQPAAIHRSFRLTFACAPTIRAMADQ
jgi:hypothetical protein